MNLKITYEDKTHKLFKKPTNFDELVECLKEKYDLSSDQYELKYEDSDKDLLNIDHENDFKSALEYMALSNMVCLKIFLHKKKANLSEASRPEYKLTVNPDDFDHKKKEDQYNDFMKRTEQFIEKSIQKPDNFNRAENFSSKKTDDSLNKRDSSLENFDKIIDNFDKYSEKNPIDQLAEKPFKSYKDQNLDNEITTNLKISLDQILKPETEKNSFNIIIDRKSDRQLDQGLKTFEKEKNKTSCDSSSSMDNNNSKLSQFTRMLNILPEEESVEDFSDVEIPKNDSMNILCGNSKKCQRPKSVKEKFIPKNILIHCFKCLGTKTQMPPPYSKAFSSMLKSPRSCKKCLKTGTLKVGSELIKLAKHLLIYKLENKYKKLVDLDADIFEQKIVLDMSQFEKDIQKNINVCGFQCTQCQSDFSGSFNRYKCSQCPEFYLCEDCEGLTNHDHVFIKIYASTNLTGCKTFEEIKTGPISNKSGKISNSSAKIASNVNNINNNSFIVKPPLPPKTSIKAELKFATTTIETVVGEKFHQIADVINKGEVNWNISVNLKCVSGPEDIEGVFEIVGKLKIGERKKLHIPMEAPNTIGKFDLGWRLVYIDEKGESQFIGNRVDFRLMVAPRNVPPIKNAPIVVENSNLFIL